MPDCHRNGLVVFLGGLGKKTGFNVRQVVFFLLPFFLYVVSVVLVSYSCKFASVFPA